MLMKLDKVVIDSLDKYSLIIDALDSIDSTGDLTNHSKLVAYTMYKMMQTLSNYCSRDMRMCCTFTLLHDIGMALEKTKNDSNIFSHSIYGYIMFKYIANCGEIANSILYHHLDYSNMQRDKPVGLRFASSLHVADTFVNSDFNLSTLEEFIGIRYSPESVVILKRALSETNLIEGVQSGSYSDELSELLKYSNYSSMSLKYLLRSLVYTTNCNNSNASKAVSYSAYLSWILGDMMGISNESKSKMYINSALAGFNRYNQLGLDETEEFIVNISEQVSEQLIKIDAEITPSKLHECITGIKMRGGQLNLSNILSNSDFDYISKILRYVRSDIDKVIEVLNSEYSKLLIEMSRKYLRK